MKKVIENLGNLFKIKSLFSLAVMLVFVVLALNGSIPPTEVMIIISMVVSFYFGTQHEKKTGTAGTGRETEETVVVKPAVESSEPATVDTSMYNAMHPTEKI